DSAGLGQRLQTGCEVDAIAIKVAALDDDVTEIDADAQHDALVVRLADPGLGHPFLQLDGAANRIDRAGELDQHAVTHHLDNPTVVSRDKRTQNVASTNFERRQRADLVLLHKAAVANDIGGKNGGKATLAALFDHFAPMPSENEGGRFY